MSQYNLLRNGRLSSLTTSGTGNISLSFSDFDMLVDGVTTVSGVDVTSSGILYIEADLGNRIKIDDVRLYIDSATASGTILNGIDFYYKNSSTDSYTVGSKYIGNGYYYGEFPNPSAPQYVLATVSGVNATLCEWKVLNDDYIVAFGTYGDQYSQYLPSVPVGSIGDPEAIAIFNNNSDLTSPSVDAYTTIEYTGADADNYVEIADSENGTYYKITDGAMIDDDLLASVYTWSMGEFNNTQVVQTGISTTVVQLGSTKTNMVLADTAIPLLANDSGWNVRHHAMDFDRTNKKLYCMGYDSSGGPALKLYEYDYVGDIYNFIGNVNPSFATGITNANMCYSDGYIYVNSYYKGDEFGRYNLDGVANNWESLASIPNTGSSTADHAIDIVSDQTEYIYALYAALSNNIGDPNKFYRYSTISGVAAGWEELSNWFVARTGAQAYNQWTRMVYDYDHDCIYMTSSNGSPAPTHIQKYDVVTGTWDITWYDISALPYDIYREHMGMAYFENNLYFTARMDHNGAVYPMYILNVLTRSLVYDDFKESCWINGGNIFQDQRCMAMMPVLLDDGQWVIYIDTLTSYGDYMVKYVNEGWFGTYTSPIIKLNDIYKASYFLIDGSTVSGSSSYSYDPNVYNGSIRVRSSDIEPIGIDEFYWPVDYASDNHHIGWFHFDLHENSECIIDNVAVVGHAYDSYDVKCMAVDSRTGYKAFSARYEDGSENVKTHIYVYDEDDTLINTLDEEDGRYGFSHIVFDLAGDAGSFWAYCDEEYLCKLWHFSSELDVLFELEADEEGAPFITDLCAVPLVGDDVELTDNAAAVVMYTDSSNSNKITMLRYTGVNATSDEDYHGMKNANTSGGYLCPIFDDSLNEGALNGVWYSSVSSGYVYKYKRNYDGSVAVSPITSYAINGTAEGPIVSDYSGGFWYFLSHFVYRVDKNGNQVVAVQVNDVDSIASTHTGCFAHGSGIGFRCVFIDKTLGLILHEWYYPDAYDTKYCLGPVAMHNSHVPVPFSVNYDDCRRNKLNLLPREDDPVWSTSSGTLEWEEVQANGYFLPKKLYHQVEITLRAFDDDAVPMLEGIHMAPSVKISDIDPQTSKDIYIRTNIPTGTDITDYEATIRTWWGIPE